MPITASMLYDLVHCPHRVGMDAFTDQALRDPVSPFVELLWERGSAFERETIANVHVAFLDLSECPTAEREARTLDAMRRGDPFIYSGRITVDDLVGVPDILRREGDRYVPGDIKSGAGEEGPDDHRTLKKHYAVQLALYVDILERKGLSAGRHAFVWDVHRDEVRYDFALPQGASTPETWWDLYVRYLRQAQAILGRTEATLPAGASICKQCHWRSACIARLEASDDLTLIPELGRTKRDAMASRIPTVRALAAAVPADFAGARGRTVFTGIGPDTLEKFHRRAQLLCDDHAAPYLTQAITLPQADRELFFDIELDPMRDVCYLHGFVERFDRRERYVPFYADRPEPRDEEAVFAAAWAFVQQSLPCAIYYYSPYERTHWKRLTNRYPSVCSEADVEELFALPGTVDLYTTIVRRATEWPTHDHSIKTLARYLGFRWRDTDPSGAASIEWYHRWVQSGDAAVKQRLLEYNEDDCIATRVLLDGIRGLPLRA